MINMIANGGKSASRVRCSLKPFFRLVVQVSDTEGQASMKQKTLLLVDDEHLVLHSLAKKLASESLEVTPAENGEQAISLMKGRSFDIVVTDLSMPRFDGLEVLKSAKELDFWTTVIILTGNGDMESAVNALRLGADDFLLKPCDPNELLHRVTNCLLKQDLQKKMVLNKNYLLVCSYCKKVRDGQWGEYSEGSWYTLEEYFNKTSIKQISHGCCPGCYAEQLQRIYTNQNE